MTVLEKLYWLTDKNDGMGIPFSVIARYSRCNPSTLGNYIAGKSHPTRRMNKLLEDGINNIVEIINDKFKDEWRGWKVIR